MDQPPSTSVIPEVIDLIPALRAYARSLSRNRIDADDLVQEALLKALANIDKFQPGTHLRAWLFTILRNTFFTSIRVSAREPTGAGDCASGALSVSASQEWAVRGRELMAAIDRLPSHYREALVLVVMLGESYEDAARICKCETGTIKSRINRARRLVIAELDQEQDRAGAI